MNSQSNNSGLMNFYWHQHFVVRKWTDNRTLMSVVELVMPSYPFQKYKAYNVTKEVNVIQMNRTMINGNIIQIRRDQGYIRSDH